jgi:hypothetical protein
MLVTHLVLEERREDLQEEVAKAESVAKERRAKVQEAEAAARKRFPLLRVRQAEARQKEAVERLERLALLIFDAPKGVELKRVEVLQAPAETLLHRFSVEGSAVTQAHLSLGSLADYHARLQGAPGLTLAPLKRVKVVDVRPEGEGDKPIRQAITQFTLKGTAP